MEIRNLQFYEYLINLKIEENEIIGIYSQKMHIVTELLLIIAGINRSKDNVFYNGLDAYDSNNFFKHRIYFDCRSDIVQTLNVEKIGYVVNFAFKKKVDLEKLTYIIRTLDLRGEVEITQTLEYIFSNVGRTLINLALGLSIENHLIINKPTIHINNKKELDFIKLELKKHQGFKIMGLDDFSNLKDVLDRIIILTDYDTVVELQLRDEVFYLIEDCLDIKEYRLFKAFGNRLIASRIPKDILKQCDKKKIKYEKVNINELQKYISH